ncbi:LysR family transcriptional regulator [Nocardia sp. 2]|uniref:LysR family transcriptional regulator n=1 Tax=Nocardia acididurans TaxID=2802282 RepID=A0ABS1M327_9NOCA|nr:LysR family transcriptional regulator [Nocardia acididurans]MBL1074445.1 LysR family transcriptional regulator [Nocardia acididurans]
MLERVEIEVFLTLAEELHFGRTAERLLVTTSRVSQIIGKLERRVGAPLFDRTSRSVRLTPIGEQLRADLRPAYEQLGAGLKRAIASGQGLTGTLRVGYSTLWCGDLVVRTADRFRILHPGCAIHIQEVQLTDPLGPLRTGRLDVQLTELPIEEPDIVRGPLVYSEPRALIVPANHRLADHDSVSLEDLADQTLLSMSGESIPPYWLEHHYPRHTPSGRGIRHGDPILYWQEVLAHIAVGRGVSVAAARGAHYYTRPGIVFVPFRDAPTIDYGLLWRVDNDDNVLVRAFADALLEQRAGER